MTDYNGAYQTYADKTSSKVFFRNTDRQTKTVTIKTGQVLKALSFLETDTAGKAIAHSGVNEVATITFPTTIDTGETVIIAGLTFTAGTNATTTQAQLVAAWKNIPAGTGYAAAATLAGTAVSAAIGTFTAGTLTGYASDTSATAGSVDFRSTTANAGVADLTVTGTGDASTVTIVPINDPKAEVAGVLVYDVDASSADVDAPAYTDASFWADALVWSVDVDTDTITKEDGTTVACTHYNTGCAGTSAAAKLLQKKFVEGTKFEQLGFIKAGEQY
jgi:hypothetical protein